MPGERAAQWTGRSLIEEDAHDLGGRSLAAGRSGNRETLDSMIQHGEHLFAGHTWKPQKEVVNAGTAFEVLEERLHGHASPTEHPCTAHSLGHALGCRACGPINHVGTLLLLDGCRNRPNPAPLSSVDGAHVPLTDVNGVVRRELLA